VEFFLISTPLKLPRFGDRQLLNYVFLPAVFSVRYAGSVAGNSQSNRSTITRDESTTIVQPLGFTEIDRVFKSNATQQVIGQNRRGFWLIPGDPNFAFSLAIIKGAESVKAINPNLA
jgi:hypothetical protein